MQYSVREFIEWSVRELGLTIQFSGSGIDEVGTVTAVEGELAPALSVGDVVVRIDPRYFRPAEVETLLGDPTKAKVNLGWVPEITAQEMCAEMVAEDHKAAFALNSPAHQERHSSAAEFASVCKSDSFAGLLGPDAAIGKVDLASSSAATVHVAAGERRFLFDLVLVVSASSKPELVRLADGWRTDGVRVMCA